MVDASTTSTCLRPPLLVAGCPKIQGDFMSLLRKISPVFLERRLNLALIKGPVCLDNFSHVMCAYKPKQALNPRI